MTDFIDEIDYDKLVEQALKNVVYYALKIVEEQGLPGDNHFYITFRTDHKGTVVSHNLKVQYPESMTIVLQNQFSNLVVRHNSFSVDLSFGGILQTITVPYEAITYFADPSAKFGLSFESIDDETASLAATIPDSSTQSSNDAEIISLDKYRRK